MQELRVRDNGTAPVRNENAEAARTRVCLPEWNDRTRPEQYFSTCEKLFAAAQIPDRLWVGQLVHKLSDKARSVYSALPNETANDYKTLKRAILNEYKVAAGVYRRNFFTWTKRPSQTFSEFNKTLREQLECWVDTPDLDTPNWPELLLKYRFESQLSEELSLFVVDKKVSTLAECIELADEFVLNRRLISRVHVGHTNNRLRESRGPAQNPGRVESRPDTGSNYNARANAGPPERNDRRVSVNLRPEIPRKYCRYCQRSGHTQQECFADPSSPRYKGSRPSVGPNRFTQRPEVPPGSSQSSALVSNLREGDSEPDVLNPLYTEYSGEACVSGSATQEKCSVRYLRDTGATISILQEGAVQNAQLEYTGERVTLRGINMVAGTYPLAKIYVKCDLFEGIMTAAVVSHRPVPGISLLLGNDVFAPQSEMKVTCGVVTRARAREMPNYEIDTSMLWQEGTAGRKEIPSEPAASETTAVETSEIPDPVVESIHGRGDNSSLGEEFTSHLDPCTLLKEQEGDSTLAPLWELADREGIDTEGYYVKEQPRLLMRRDQPGGQNPAREWKVRNQLVVPVKYRADVMRLAHEHMTSGHQGHKKTLSRLMNHFFWPGIRRDVNDFCRGCGPCQRLGRGTQCKVAPLKPLPVVGKPFELISADFVGPLAITPSGNRYILNIVDHATKYVESFPLPSANAINATKVFTEVFSRHGIPGKLLTDRGSTFVGEVFEHFLEGLGVRHLLSSPYRPQTNGAVEKLNGTLKTMIKLVLEENKQAWDEVLPWVLFAYRSSAHSSTGYSPFFLMYGREPPGPMESVYDRWSGAEHQEAVPVNDYIHDLCTRVSEALEEARATAEEGAKDRKKYYDRTRKVKAVDFNPGDSVLVHLPLIGKPLVGAWQGPYLIQEKVGSHTYVIHMPDKRIKRRIFHVNAIKPWTEREPTHAALSVELVETEQVSTRVDRLLQPTELETWYDPCNFGATKCQPSGEWPDCSHLSREKQAQLTQLFRRYPTLFSGELGRFKGVTHDIDVGESRPIRQHFYRTSPEKLDIMKVEIDKMLSMGVIQPSHSEWASPMILVKKPNNEWRPCVDYRKVNTVTRGDSYPLPRLDDLIDRVGKAKFLTTLDLSKGFWQVPLTVRAREISAFVTPFGHYEPLTTPFGLKSAPITFQRAMNTALAGLEHFADAYQDDVAVQSMEWEEHLDHLDQVFHRMSTAGVTLNSQKCKVGVGTVVYLGHQVGSGRVEPIATKVDAMLKIPPPETKKQLRSFLGVVGFYRRFIPKYSELAAPLTDLLRGGVPGDITLVWQESCRTAFESLKACLAQRPVLKAPDFTAPFEMYTDASDLGIAAVLTQLEDDMPKPISFYSRKLLPREQNYSTVEKELLAIMAGLHTFRVYVGHGPIVVNSDHNPLVWLNQSRTSNQRILRWALCLSEYELEIKHIKGRDNVLADLLSRRLPESGPLSSTDSQC